ncbi:hypothetical protein F4777DRAFT_563901 [Nemania sp. FL0916]|nr:hypothetical protein F4777DRAFT_563901 [Nemania sp. FL0916]
MFRSIAIILFFAVHGIQATMDGDFGVWRVVAGLQICDSLHRCRQSYTITSDGNAENMLPAFSISATCFNLGGCEVDDIEPGLHLSNNCVPGSLSLTQTIANATGYRAAWGSAPWRGGDWGEFTIPVSKLYIYGR